MLLKELNCVIVHVRESEILSRQHADLRRHIADCYLRNPEYWPWSLSAFVKVCTRIATIAVGVYCVCGVGVMCLYLMYSTVLKENGLVQGDTMAGMDIDPRPGDPFLGCVYNEKLPYADRIQGKTKYMYIACMPGPGHTDDSGEVCRSAYLASCCFMPYLLSHTRYHCRRTTGATGGNKGGPCYRHQVSRVGTRHNILVSPAQRVCSVHSSLQNVTYHKAKCGTHSS